MKTKTNMKDRIQLEFHGVFVHSENINIPILYTRQKQSAKERLKNIGLPMWTNRMACKYFPVSINCARDRFWYALFKHIPYIAGVFCFVEVEVDGPPLNIYIIYPIVSFIHQAVKWIKTDIQKSGHWRESAIYWFLSQLPCNRNNNVPFSYFCT